MNARGFENVLVAIERSADHATTVEWALSFCTASNPQQ